MSRLPQPVAVTATHLKVAVLNELQYRSNFFLQILQSIIQVATGLVVVAVVFSKTSDLNGWTRSELLAAIGVFTIVGGLIRTFIQPPVIRMMYGIQEGEFDFTLTRPVDAQLLMSVREINFWQLADVVAGAGIVVAAVPGMPSALGVGDVLAFLALLAAGSGIAYCMWLAVATIAFWVVRIPSIDNLFYYVARSAQYPITIYPTWFRLTLTAVVPLGIAVTAPAQAITSRLDGGTVAAMFGVLMAFIVISRALWIRGVRRYSGASS